MGFPMLEVFVYGTLKPGAANYPHYCTGCARAARAWVEGQLYDLPFGYPAAIAAPGRVEGYVLTFADARVLAALDDLEDWNPQRSPAENVYNRYRVPAYGADGEIARVWCYFMDADRARALGTRVESGWWESGR